MPGFQQKFIKPILMYFDLHNILFPPSTIPIRIVDVEVLIIICRQSNLHLNNKTSGVITNMLCIPHFRIDIKIILYRFLFYNSQHKIQ